MQALGGSGAFPRRFSDDSLRSRTDLRERVVQSDEGHKEGLEPVVGDGLEVAKKFEKTQLPLLAGPQRSTQGWTDGIG